MLFCQESVSLNKKSSGDESKSQSQTDAISNGNLDEEDDSGAAGGDLGGDSDDNKEDESGGPGSEATPPSFIKLTSSSYGPVDSTLTTASASAWSSALPGLSTPRSLAPELFAASATKMGVGQSSTAEEARENLADNLRTQKIESFQHLVSEDFKGAEDLLPWVRANFDEEDRLLQKFLPIIFYEGGGAAPTELTIEVLIQKIQSSIQEMDEMDFSNVLNNETLVVSGFVYVFMIRAMAIIGPITELFAVAGVEAPEDFDMTWTNFTKLVDSNIENPPKKAPEGFVARLKTFKHQWEVLILVLFAVYVRKTKNGGASGGFFRDLNEEDIDEKLLPWHWDYPSFKFLCKEEDDEIFTLHMGAMKKRLGRDFSVGEPLENGHKLANHFPVSRLGREREKEVIHETDEIDDLPDEIVFSFLRKFNVVQTHNSIHYFFAGNFEKLLRDSKTNKEWIPSKEWQGVLEKAEQYFKDHAIYFADYQPEFPFVIPSPIPRLTHKKSLEVDDETATKKPKSNPKTAKTKKKRPAATETTTPKASNPSKVAPHDPLSGLGTHLRKAKSSREEQLKIQKEKDEKIRKEKEMHEKKLLSSATKKKVEDDEADAHERLSNMKDKSTSRKRQSRSKK